MILILNRFCESVPIAWFYKEGKRWQKRYPLYPRQTVQRLCFLFDCDAVHIVLKLSFIAQICFGFLHPVLALFFPSHVFVWILLKCSRALFTQPQCLSYKELWELLSGHLCTLKRIQKHKRLRRSLTQAGSHLVRSLPSEHLASIHPRCEL